MNHILIDYGAVGGMTMVRLDAKEKLDKYLREYGSYYSSFELSNIRKNFLSYIYHHNYRNDLFDEIAAYLDLDRKSTRLNSSH
mgnify:CR=1 FL=1